MLESKFLQENIQNIKKLMDIPTLKHFETRNLGRLLRLSKIRQYQDGECIIREGDLDPWLYFLLSGKLRISKEGIDIAFIEKRGEIVGEMRIISSLSRSASVFAVGPTICLAVDTTAHDRLSGQDEVAEFLLLLYRVFTEFVTMRLRLTSEELVIAKKSVQRLMSETLPAGANRPAATAAARPKPDSVPNKPFRPF